MQEVEKSNHSMVENMKQVSEVMQVMTKSIVDADDNTKVMRSKYRETATNVGNIETIVGKLIEELGQGGFMSVEDVEAGMAATLKDMVSCKEYKGVVSGVENDRIVVEFTEADDVALGASDYQITIVVRNEMYSWDHVSVMQSAPGTATIVVDGNPKVFNRRKHPRMPIKNTCTIEIAGVKSNISGRMINISAGGFAFSSMDVSLKDAKEQEVQIVIHDFPLISASKLTGQIIRVTDNSGNYIVGCRMPEEREDILTYVKENYVE